MFGDLVPSGAEGLEEYQKLLGTYQKRLVAKWKPLLAGDPDRGIEPIASKHWNWMAMVFENQSYIRPTNRNPLLETTATTDIVLPVKYTLPIIRKVYPQLIVSEIAGIQPMPLMSGGSAKIFYLTFKESTAGTTLHDNLDSDRAIKGEGLVPLKIKLTVTSETITAVKHILGAQWTTESMEDAQFSLGLNVEQELLNAMSDEILRELNYEYLNVLLAGASAGNTDWSSTIPDGRDPNVHYQTLYDAMVDSNNLIFGARYKDADFIIAGTTLAGYLEKIPTFKGVDSDVAGNRGAVGVRRIGTLQSRWDVFKTTLITATKGIMGMYPQSAIDANFIYAPYIPMAPMPLVYAGYDETTGNYQNVDSYTRNVRSRDAHKLVNADGYSTVTVT